MTRKIGYEKFGHRKRPEYRCWSAIIQRCTNPNNPSYGRYGGAGITVCDEWRQSFDAFFLHIGPRPSAIHSIDRINGKRGYEPGNVRWATPYEQAQNQAKTRFITAFGETHCLSEWARLRGLPLLTLHSRLEKLCWPAERALSVPKRGRGNHPAFDRAIALAAQEERP